MTSQHGKGLVMSKRSKIRHRLGWLAYGLSPMWLAAVMALYGVRDEAQAVSSRQASELAR
jgi:hypothetical protein